MKSSASMLEVIKKICLNHSFESEIEEREFIKELLGVCSTYNIINQDNMRRLISDYGVSNKNITDLEHLKTEQDNNMISDDGIREPEKLLYEKICDIIKQHGKPYMRINEVIDMLRLGYRETIVRDRVIDAVKGTRKGEIVFDLEYDCVKLRNYSGICDDKNREDYGWTQYMNTTR
ncbi:MAG TPA: hypothetical protein VEF53_20030 [Patescibacteria group bacterium]|nr:hypothetical protein [Patescibacteria group bacterium]